MVPWKNSDNLKQVWQAMDHELVVESHSASMEELAAIAPPVYVHKQKKGDLILLPPNMYHQVVNKVRRERGS
jgi:oxalate decarboxylase/phosphoglucose isomerase-like protein (cupin superfamily)